MKRNSQRLFMMEMVLAVILLVISISVTNLIFVRSMTQHQKNEAMLKMSETMVMISEEIQSQNSNQIYLTNSITSFDSDGNQVDSDGYYQLYIEIDVKESYRLYTLSLFTLSSEKLLSWDVIKVVE